MSLYTAAYNDNFSFLMPLGCHRRICVLSLAVLILVLLSTETDLLLDHTPAQGEHFESIRGHPIQQHLLRDGYGKKVPPCNACLFHKLLAHSLIPKRNIFATAAQFIQSSSIQRLYSAQSFFRREVSRGPPHNSISLN